jgi:hypothetical protein
MYSEKVAKRFFTDKLKAMSLELYAIGGSENTSRDWLDLAKKMDGFIEAGKTIQLISSVEAQAVIDAAHLATFGEGREERRKKLQQGVTESDHDVGIDWDQYDSPTVTRRGDL